MKGASGFRKSLPPVAIAAFLLLAGCNKNPSSPTAPVSGGPVTGQLGVGLWVANNHSGAIVKYSTAQLGASTSVAPEVAVSDSGGVLSSPAGLAFDAAGNLWVASADDSTLAGVSNSQLGASGSPRASVVIHTLPTPNGILFDRSGNLWVMIFLGGKVVKYSPPKLSANGTPSPDVVLTATGGSLKGPAYAAFDAGGNLWISNFSAPSIIKFSSSQLSASGSPVPTVTLTSDAGLLSGPTGLAFDSQGNLWVANAPSNAIVRFTPGQIAASGSPAPGVIISAANGSLNFPAGIAFDNSGNLWVANIAGQSIVKFSAGQLAASGAPSPEVTLNGASLPQPYAMAFYPPPSGVPIAP